MGGERPEREMARARIACIGASRRFVTAFAGYVAAGISLGPPDSGAELPLWTHGQVGALLELQAALNELVDTRRSYDAMRHHRG